MKLGYDNAFDVLADAHADQEREARNERIDQLVRTPAFIRAVNDDESEFDGKGWATVGRAAQERDRELERIAQQERRLIDSAEAEYRRRLERIERERRAAVDQAHSIFESRQAGRLHFLASRQVP